MKPKKRGRPPKITLPIVQKIGEWIALGMTEEQACCKEGVNLRTFQSAKEKEEFSAPIKKAQAEFLARALTAIADGGEPDVVTVRGTGGIPISKVVGRKPWTGLAWILERRHKPQFNRTETVAPSDDMGRPFISAKVFEAFEQVGKDLTAAMAARDAKMERGKK